MSRVHLVPGIPRRAVGARLGRRLAALTLGLSLVASPALSALRKAKPALWVVRDADTTLYLFGTVHLLPKDLAWFEADVAKAFAASSELKLEILPPDDPTAMTPLIIQYAMDLSGRTMAQRLSPNDHAAYVAVLQRLGLPAEAMEQMEPWFVTLTTASMLYAKQGLDPESGAETVLVKAARQAGKAITALETPEQQFSLLESTPESEQLAMLQDLIQRPEAAQSLTRQIVDVWAEGNAEAAGTLMNENMKRTPQTTRMLLTERNIRWAQQLQERLASPGVVFVAVGAGHLTGSNSVPELLSKAGFQVERVR
ncbi:MAG: TraB/GumN family protein [Synechococcaceae cyanobacterium]|nr:TraB/GumN family protein [Synechococcaceae cyanobacterium]